MGILQCAINGANGSGNAYFFADDHFVVFDWNRTTSAGGATFKGRAVSGPFPVGTSWNLPSNVQPPFDAALSGDAGGSPAYAHKMYFFKDASYARYDYTAAPVRVSDSGGDVTAWSLRGFDRNVRGAFNGKKSRLGYAYFFKGPNYVRYNWAKDAGEADYPKTIASLIAMPAYFAPGIDAALDGDGDFADYGYLFRDDNYCRFDWDAVRVDNGPAKVWQNWPGVLELLLGAQAKNVALAWVSDARNQLNGYTAQLNTGIPSPFNTVVMDAALAAHFHAPASMDATRRMGFLTQIRAELERIENTLTNFHNVVVFHDDGEVKDKHPSYSAPDGSPTVRAYTRAGDHIYLTSRFISKTDTEFTAAAVLIHEAVHFTDAQADVAHDVPEWYEPPLSRIAGLPHYYSELAPDAALHNPSSYAAFSQHVHFGLDRRLGTEVSRPGY